MRREQRIERIVGMVSDRIARYEVESRDDALTRHNREVSRLESNFALHLRGIKEVSPKKFWLLEQRLLTADSEAIYRRQEVVLFNRLRVSCGQLPLAVEQTPQIPYNESQ